MASRLAGFPIRVRCYSTGDWNAIEQAYGPRGGQASSNPLEIELSPGVCDDLLALLSGRVHETQHMEGISIESQAECYAMQHAVETASIMGASPAYARELADLYWSELYPTESAEYRSPLCRQGGRLDLRISSDWP